MNMNRQQDAISLILSQVQSMTELEDGNNKFIVGGQEWVVNPDPKTASEMYDLEGDVWTLAVTMLLAEVQTVEEYQGHTLVTYGDDLSPSFSIFFEGKEVEGGTLDMRTVNIKQFVNSKQSEVPVEADLALIGITI